MNPAVISHIRATAAQHGKSEALACIAMVRRCRELPGEPKLTPEDGIEMARLEQEIGRLR